MLGDLLAYLAANAAEQDWMDRALCAEVDPELWFPPKGSSGRTAKDVCRRCDVREECLAYALANDEWGVWGGMSEAERGRQEQAA